MANERQLLDLNDVFPNNMMPVITGDPWLTLKKLIDRIANAPVIDAVEVVRCKDCIFFQPYEGEEHKGDCEELVGLESCVYEDDFCSYGERRTDNG